MAFEAKGLSTPHSVGLTGTQTLFNGQQTANKVRSAESQVFAARETLRMMEESVLLSAAGVYMDVSRDSANLEVQQNNVRVLQRTLTDTKNRFQAGQVTSTDVAQAEAQLASGEATLHAAESTLMTTRANYRRIIGVEAANLAAASPVDRLAPSTLNAAVALGIAENPSVTAALYGVDVAQLQVKIAEGALWPTLVGQYSVQQQYNPQLLTPNLFTNTVSLNLTIPLYQGGAEYSAIRLDKENLGQQRLNVDQVRDQTRANVVQAWGQLQAAKAQVEAAVRQNDAAERALTGVRNEAMAGQRTTQDVLNAEQALGECPAKPPGRAARSRGRVIRAALGRWPPVGARTSSSRDGLRPASALSSGPRQLDWLAHAERGVNSVVTQQTWLRARRRWKPIQSPPTWLTAMRTVARSQRFCTRSTPLELLLTEIY